MLNPRCHDRRPPRSSRAKGLAATLLLVSGCVAHAPYHRVQFLDAETGRGIPLVELETMNEVRYVSDSAGLVAIEEPDLMGQTLYLQAHSHGYDVPADRFGFRGVRVELSPGGSTIVRLARSNLAERLYRVTGQGIYRDSHLLHAATPTFSAEEPAGGVFGQDSVVNAIYGGRLYWFWGDTERGGYPLGNFEVAGATSQLPAEGGLDPAVGVDLHYFVGTDGFSRPMCPIEGPGPVWISGLVVLEGDSGGPAEMLCHYARMRDLGNMHEHGIAAWDPVHERFVKLAAFPLDAPLHLQGHPFALSVDGVRRFYFGNPFPHTRVAAEREAILDPARYEAFTPLQPGSRLDPKAPPPLERDQQGRPVWGWKRNTPSVTPAQWRAWVEAGHVDEDGARTDLFDVETGELVLAHGGSVAWNDHRRRWVMIALQQGGHSPLGEVWYAEATSPLGPWSAARRIVTHDRYTFYNVKQHPYFAHDSHIYFEGTYTISFSGNDRPTPRYDYNQIMYRLDLEDARLPHAPEVEASAIGSGDRSVTSLADTRRGQPPGMR